MTPSINEITQAAEKLFGNVIEIQNNILLIQRDKGLPSAPLNRYMTIEATVLDGKVHFRSGDYNMSLSDAAHSLAIRAVLTCQLKQIEIKERTLINQAKEDALTSFLDFLDTYLDDAVTEGEALSDLTSSDRLDTIKDAFLAAEQVQPA